jgi:hypothetical protein
LLDKVRIDLVMEILDEHLLLVSQFRSDFLGVGRSGRRDSTLVDEGIVSRGSRGKTEEISVLPIPLGPIGYVLVDDLFDGRFVVYKLNDTAGVLLGLASNGEMLQGGRQTDETLVKRDIVLLHPV